MMLASQIRAKARESLKNKWGKAALITLIFIIISLILSSTDTLSLSGVLAFVVSLAVTVISIPLSYGLVATFIKLKRNEKVTYTTFLSEGFANFGKVWKVTLWTFLKLLPWIILFIVAMLLSVVGTAFLSVNSATDSPVDSYIGSVSNIAFIAAVAFIVSLIMLIIKGFAYAMNYYLIYDNPTLASKEIVKKSAIMMKKNKWRFFCLTLSFIGWTFLSSLTLGIGMLWLTPYQQVSIVHFYEDLLGKSE